MRGLVVALLAASSVARADDDLDVAGLDATDMRGDALAWEDATFYLEPWEGGLSIRFSTFGRGRRDEVGCAIPIRIVDSSMRTFVEVELVDRLDCANRRVAPEPRVEALRLFVKRDDLAPVLVKPYSVAFGDGTGVKLSPGVPVAPTVAGLYTLTARGDKLRLPIPHASVGYVYARGKVTEPEPPMPPIVRIDRSGAVRFGDESFEARAPWVTTKPAKPSEHALLKLSTRCIELTVSAPTSSLRPHSLVPRGSVFSPSTGVPLKQSHFILRGAPLLTTNGRAAAVAAEVIPVGAPYNDTSCFESRLTMARLDEAYAGTMTRTFRLCAAQNHVAPDGTLPALPATGPTAAPSDVAKPPPDAKRTARGVLWKQLAAGKGGKKPSATDSVRVHYAGWTTDGRLFDASYTRGQPGVFPLTGVIPGWVEGLQVMSVGDKIRMWIPEELAYKGAPGRPAGMLVYDIELLAIQ